MPRIETTYGQNIEVAAPHTTRAEILPVIGKKLVERETKKLWEQGYEKAIEIANKGFAVVDTDKTTGKLVVAVRNAVAMNSGQTRRFDVQIGSSTDESNIDFYLTIQAEGDDGGSLHYSYQQDDPNSNGGLWFRSAATAEHGSHYLPTIAARGLLQEFVGASFDSYKTQEKLTEYQGRMGHIPTRAVVPYVLPERPQFPSRLPIPVKLTTSIAA